MLEIWSLEEMCKIEDPQIGHERMQLNSGEYAEGVTDCALVESPHWRRCWGRSLCYYEKVHKQ